MSVKNVLYAVLEVETVVFHKPACLADTRVEEVDFLEMLGGVLLYSPNSVPLELPL